METIHQKATVLTQALPYIKKFHGKTIVIKYGENAMIDEKLKQEVLHDIVLLNLVGINPVIVHGGGPSISEEMKKANISPQFIDGLRVTDEATMRIVKKVFKRINKEIENILEKGGARAIGLSGDEHSLIMVKQKDKRLGLVGDIVKINPDILMTIVRDNYVPVISPIGVDEEGQSYNINADTAAAAIASALKAEKLTILTNVEGVMEGKKLVSTLTVSEAKEKIARGVIHSGMIPKVEACIEAVHHGVKKAHLIDGTTPHTLLIEIFTDKGIGTEIVKS